jgi:UDP-N-acetylglucosamine pyrophosphorylase
MALGILAGGMATRFGMGVKAIAAVGELSGSVRTFLEVKSAHTRWAEQRFGHIVQALMTSFVTDKAIAEDERMRGHYGLDPDRVWHSEQPLVPECCWRVPDTLGLPGQPVLDGEGRMIHHPAGSFEAIPQLIRDGTLARLLRRSVTYLGISNLDNFGITMEPALVGMLHCSGRAALVEGVRRRPQDIGAWVGVGESGEARFVEKGTPGGALRLEYADFANISSWIIHLPRFMHELGLGKEDLLNLSPDYLGRRVTALFSAVPWHNVIKAVPDAASGIGTAPRPVLQRERFLSDLALVASTLFVQTDRRTRYFPLKERADVAALNPRTRSLIERQLHFVDS